MKKFLASLLFLSLTLSCLALIVHIESGAFVSFPAAEKAIPLPEHGWETSNLDDTTGPLPEDAWEKELPEPGGDYDRDEHRKPEPEDAYENELKPEYGKVKFPKMSKI